MKLKSSSNLLTLNRDSGSIKNMILPFILWIMLWGGYNTGIERILDPEFPGNTIDLLHGLRAFLPILAGYIAVISLLKGRSFPGWVIHGPIGLLFLYVFIGGISTLVLSREIIISIYWLSVYGSVPIVLMMISATSDYLKRLTYLISLNWVIVAIIMTSLLLALLFLSDVALSETEGSPLRVRAFAGDFAHSGQMWGMAATRGTGFGRYASIAAMVALIRLWEGKWLLRSFWFLILSLSTYSLILSQARTAVLSFVGASSILLWVRKSSRPILLSGAFLILLFLYFAGFYQAFWHYLTRGEVFDPTLSGRTELWEEGLGVIEQSILIGFGFHADRIYMDGQHMHNALLHALIQTGIIGTLPFIIAFVGIWILLFRFNRARRQSDAYSLNVEITAVIVFFTISSITESTIAFYGVAWLIVAPLIAYLQAWNYTAQTNLLYIGKLKSTPYQQFTYHINAIKKY